MTEPTLASGFDGCIVGILGGSEPQGRGLAKRFAASGVSVVLGSRSAGRAMAASVQLGDGMRGARNDECVDAADVVVVALPWDAHTALLESLTKKLAHRIVADCFNSLGFDQRRAYVLPVHDGSAA